MMTMTKINPQAIAAVRKPRFQQAITEQPKQNNFEATMIVSEPLSEDAKELLVNLLYEEIKKTNPKLYPRTIERCIEVAFMNGVEDKLKDLIG